jgi:hypothetical protein
MTKHLQSIAYHFLGLHLDHQDGGFAPTATDSAIGEPVAAAS